MFTMCRYLRWKLSNDAERFKPFEGWCRQLMFLRDDVTSPMMSAQSAIQGQLHLHLLSSRAFPIIWCPRNGYEYQSSTLSCLVRPPPLTQTCQLPRVTRESHGFLHFLQSHGRGNSCSRVYSCPTVLFSHRLLPIIIAGNTFWQHKFTVK